MQGRQRDMPARILESSVWCLLGPALVAMAAASSCGVQDTVALYGPARPPMHEKRVCGQTEKAKGASAPARRCSVSLRGRPAFWSLPVGLVDVQVTRYRMLHSTKKDAVKEARQAACRLGGGLLWRRRAGTARVGPYVASWLAAEVAAGPPQTMGDRRSAWASLAAVAQRLSRAPAECALPLGTSVVYLAMGRRGRPAGGWLLHEARLQPLEPACMALLRQVWEKGKKSPSGLSGIWAVVVHR